MLVSYRAGFGAEIDPALSDAGVIEWHVDAFQMFPEFVSDHRGAGTPDAWQVLAGQVEPISIIADPA